MKCASESPAGLIKSDGLAHPQSSVDLRWGSKIHILKKFTSDADGLGPHFENH